MTQPLPPRDSAQPGTHVAASHTVQLFDDAQSRIDAVTAFARDALMSGDTVLIVARADHGQAMTRRLESTVPAYAEAAARGQIVVMDADRVLAQFMTAGAPDVERFQATVGALVREMARGSKTLHIYGEMVDLLATSGHLAAAVALEDLWNDLGRQVKFTLFCGYASSHFGDPRRADALSAICRAHSRVRFNLRDALGSFLLSGLAPGSLSRDVS